MFDMSVQPSVCTDQPYYNRVSLFRSSDGRRMSQHQWNGRSVLQYPTIVRRPMYLTPATHGPLEVGADTES